MRHRLSIAMATAVAVLALATGCSSAQDQAVEMVNDAAQDQAAETQDQEAESNSSTTGSITEMPEYDFGFDEQAYLSETYGIEATDHMDLINAEQLAWLMNRNRSSAVAMLVPDDAASNEMAKMAQEECDGIGFKIFAYEPNRDAEDGDFAALGEELDSAGLTGIGEPKPGTLLILKSNALEPDVATFEAVDEARAAIEDNFRPACCG